jgi:hypothetical protein
MNRTVHNILQGLVCNSSRVTVRRAAKRVSGALNEGARNGNRRTARQVRFELTPRVRLAGGP